jgi:hypothetical protein
MGSLMLPWRSQTLPLLLIRCRYEGLFGSALMLVVVLPLMQISRLGPEGGGLREDSLESLHMLRHSPTLAACAAAFVACMAVYNVAGMLVTDSLGALSRTVAETLRTLLVWVLDLWLYCNLRRGDAKVGEPWTSTSWLQAAGFGVLVAGTALYSWGEERAAARLRAELRRRARERWAALRHSVGDLVRMGRLELSGEEAATPVRRARIACPARIRIALALPQVRRRLAREAQGLAAGEEAAHA